MHAFRSDAQEIIKAGATPALPRDAALSAERISALPNVLIVRTWLKRSDGSRHLLAVCRLVAAAVKARRLEETARNARLIKAQKPGVRS